MFPALRMVVNGCVDPACFCGPLTVRVGTWSQDVEEWTPALSTGFTKGTFPPLPLSYNMKKKKNKITSSFQSYSTALPLGKPMSPLKGSGYLFSVFLGSNNALSQNLDGI